MPERGDRIKGRRRMYEAEREAERVRRRQEAAEGRKLRDAAINQADEHAAPDWKTVAYAVVTTLTETMGEFTTDDVWYELQRSGPHTHEPRALGAIMRKAAAAGLIEPSNPKRYEESTRAVCHRAPKLVWRSKR